MTRLLCVTLMSLGLVSFLGCGSGDGVTVITPGEDYELSDQEQKNLDEEKRMREEAGR